MLQVSRFCSVDVSSPRMDLVLVLSVQYTSLVWQYYGLYHLWRWHYGFLT